MNPKLWNLIWSELCQRRTQLGVCLLCMLGGAVYYIATTSAWEAFSITAFIYGLFAAIFLAMRTALGESTDRTRSFSDGLPIAAGQRGWIRLAGGAVVLVVPIVAGAVLLLCWLGPGTAMLWCLTAVMAWSATTFYLILSLLGTTLRAESHLGYCGAALACLWFLGVNLGRAVASAGYPEIAVWTGALAPQSLDSYYFSRVTQGSVDDWSIMRALVVPLLANTVIQMVLAAMFVRRYGRLLPGGDAGSAKEGPAMKAVTRRSWRLRLSTRRRALVWLAWRQSLPMCLPGLGLACLLAALHIGADSGKQSLQQYADSLVSSMAMVALPWAVVVGAGIFASEIDGRIGEFWRTRPISAGQLFGLKFAAGLLAVLLVLDGSVIAATWFSPNWGRGLKSMNWAYIACFLPLHAAMFALAVAWTCRLRQAVLGGMAAFATLILAELAFSWSADTRRFSPLRACDQIYFRVIDFAHGYPVVLAELVLTLVVSIVAGWLALRRYDPRRQAD
jgi:hypothetical protein